MGAEYLTRLAAVSRSGYSGWLWLKWAVGEERESRVVCLVSTVRLLFVWTARSGRASICEDKQQSRRTSILTQLGGGASAMQWRTRSRTSLAYVSYEYQRKQGPTSMLMAPFLLTISLFTYMNRSVDACKT